MARTTFVNSSPAFAVDPHTLVRNSGRQIDWAAVAAGYVVAATGKKFIPAGTRMVLAADARRIVPAGAGAGIGLLATDAHEDDRSAALTGYGMIIGGVIYGNLLPQGAPDAATITALNNAGTGFVFETYADTRNT